jgi:hypothetical protein
MSTRALGVSTWVPAEANGRAHAIVAEALAG